MRELNVLTRNISWNYLEAGVGLVVYFFLTPIVVDALGAVGFGMWVLLNAILFYLKFLDLGFYNALVKYVAECSERRDWPTVNGLIATTIAVLLIAGVVALFGSGLVAWLLVPNVFNVPAENVAELQLATLLIGIDLLIAFPASALNAVLEGRQRFDVLSGISIPLRIAGALATVLVLDAGYGVTALVGIAVAVTVADAVACRALIGRLFPEIRLSVASIARAADTRHLMRTRSYSTWTSLNEILAEGGAELEKLLIPVLLSVSLLTPYTLIVTVCAAIFLAIEPITDTFFPLSSAYDAGSDKTRLRELLTRGTKLVVGISLPLAVAITFYGRDFILIWIGAGNVEVPERVLPLVAASFAVTAFILTGTTILLAVGRVREVFWMGIAELALAVLLVFSSVPRTGLVGLAGSLLVANVLVTAAWIVPYLCRLLGQSIVGFLGASLLRPALAAAPMALAIVGLDRALPGDSLWRIALNSGLAGAVYVGAFYAVSLTPQERALVLGSLRRMRIQ
jgi:O-antigen/teichoic acid export membrane protein